MLKEFDKLFNGLMRKFLTERFSAVIILMGGFFLILGLVIFGWQDISFDLRSPVNADKVGQLGDFIGGFVGSIWTLSGVILFYVALQQQREDLKATMDIFTKQMEESQEQRKLQILQRDTLLLQQFESTFFNVLNIYYNITIQIKEKDAAFFAERMSLLYQNISAGKPDDPESEKVLKATEEFIAKERNDFQHYLQTLIQLIFLIHDNERLVSGGGSTATNDQMASNKYVKIVKAQLSAQELRLLYYLYNYSDYFSSDFKKLIIQYQLFEFMEASYLISPDHAVSRPHHVH